MANLKIEIKSIWGSVLFSYEKEDNTVKDTVEEAVKQGASLDGASLYGASLDGASLDGASLDGASLRNAFLDGASLRNASLRNASLDGASLDGASLDGASLQPFKADLYEILVHAIPEVSDLKQAIIDGKIDGSVYQGDCACLVGTIANARRVDYEKMAGIMPQASRPAERLFAAIKKGDTPESNGIAKIVLDWIEEFELFVYPKPATPAPDTTLSSS
ncbi:hypothetical protein DCC81_12115 [Chitinophaga parva]|uniref:Pentapeptide repeat-containing protein n=1 Tax=Chitinophaga parva TaxID=2169414 RepID=A0A2T7BFI9_9BACT|nr:pentapeptide repeat-containing protein [Chitinophaga parva]PUZ25051.1 hypothetical protein DCC81_12115 [Chitinophaga parva]